MSDELKKTFDEMRVAVQAARTGLERVETLQRKTADEISAMKERMGTVEGLQRQTAEGTSDVKRHFDTFLVRFEETTEMLITHDTEQLQRVARVEQANDVLRQEWADLRSRVEALEKRAG